MGET
jgi:hypothetical protein